MNEILREKISESLSAVVPISLIVLALSVFVVPLETGTMAMFVVGAVMLIIGMALFQLGAETAMTPLGEGIGVQLTKINKYVLVIVVSALMGFIITIAEPDLQVLAQQVPAIPNLTLILTVAIGVGIFLAIAVIRIIKKIDLSILLAIMYILLIGFSLFVPKEFLAVAFDSGGVTTGPITVPFIMAMGIGISSVRSDKNSSNDSFGLIALASGGPILAVLVLGCFFNPDSAAYAASEITKVVTMQDVAIEFAKQLPHYAEEVGISLSPILLVYLVFQFATHRYHTRQKRRILIGFVYTYIGLVLFLCGVNVGFAPVGTLLGRELASLSQKWLIVPIGMLIGYYIVKAEPAIQILNHQVEGITNGLIFSSSMNRCLSIGVAASIGIAMFRVLTGIPIHWIIIPGYIVALIMSRFVPKIFVGIAFDSGGVASGPMTTTFLLPLCIGVCEALGGNIMTDAFGVVALVALTPLIAVQLMGVRYMMKNKHQKQTMPEKAAVSEEIEDIIIDFEEVGK
ncbi:MAG: DUF1538 domain-containing protein [Oscillospiraceae bacterium]|nr:DUF1538 domain-containing protein [Oscillospiraceae bacterium]